MRKGSSSWPTPLVQLVEQNLGMTVRDYLAECFSYGWGLQKTSKILSEDAGMEISVGTMRVWARRLGLKTAHAEPKGWAAARERP